MKLVRDRVPDMILRGGVTPVVRPALMDEEESLLRKKLLEEVGEVLEAGTPSEKMSELADVLEVVFAYAELLRNEDLKLPSVLQVKREKNERNGSFRRMLVWEGNLVKDNV